MKNNPLAGKIWWFAVALLCFIALLSGCADNGPAIEVPPVESGEIATPATDPAAPADSSDDVLARLFEQKESDVQVEGSGVVSMLLSDDNDGDRHQRFILELASGQTLLIAHNIDIAPRLDGLAAGDTVEFYGEYYYNEQGGGIHWTHRDPGGKHTDGWLKWDGEIYQ
ncbi:MAG: DUF3465 domain-containing protein [Gracilibacteraceae bacterium]|jgi:hypothetical protein|nr:DUF3465 domain-containing protein [Gracilibacteraceae bacterium]